MVRNYKIVLCCAAFGCYLVTLVRAQNSFPSTWPEDFNRVAAVLYSDLECTNEVGAFDVSNNCLGLDQDSDFKFGMLVTSDRTGLTYTVYGGFGASTSCEGSIDVPRTTVPYESLSEVQYTRTSTFDAIMTIDNAGSYTAPTVQDIHCVKFEQIVAAEYVELGYTSLDCSGTPAITWNFDGVCQEYDETIFGMPVPVSSVGYVTSHFQSFVDYGQNSINKTCSATSPVRFTSFMDFERTTDGECRTVEHMVDRVINNQRINSVRVRTEFARSSSLLPVILGSVGGVVAIGLCAAGLAAYRRSSGPRNTMDSKAEAPMTALPTSTPMASEGSSRGSRKNGSVRGTGGSLRGSMRGSRRE